MGYNYYVGKQYKYVQQSVQYCLFLYAGLKTNKYIHHGETLKAAVKRSGQKVEIVAKKAGYSRSTFYTHIKEPNLDWRILERYGIALQYDFTEDIPGLNKYALQEPYIRYTPRTFEEAIKQLDEARNKYEQLNDQYKQLIEEHNQLHNEYDQLKDEYIQFLKNKNKRS